MSMGWTVFIIVLLTINIVGCLWLMRVTTNIPEDEGETTGHVWDGDLRELNKPLPRWWLGLFYLTIIFSVVYMVLYPTVEDHEGLLGWSQTGQYDSEIAAAEERYGPLFAGFRGKSIEQLAADPQAVAVGASIFSNYCATCHGSDARGAAGYPNLADDDWIYGGDGDTVLASIVNGRAGVMPGLGASLGDEVTDQLVSYVLHLAGRTPLAGDALAQAQQQYVIYCSACHGPTGDGVPAIGGLRLTDDIWLYSGREEVIRDIIINGRVNQMPAQGPVIGEDRARTAAAYVLSLSRDGGS